jgi:hypothetical protein
MPLTLRFVDAREGRRLNRQFQARDHATDVLTFASHRPVVTADIVVCVPVVRRAARERGLRCAVSPICRAWNPAHRGEHHQPVAARGWSVAKSDPGRSRLPTRIGARGWAGGHPACHIAAIGEP